MYDIEKYTQIVKDRLSDYRFYHSVCVSESAKALARRYGADENKAELAGILHDICKEDSLDDQLDIINRAGYSMTELELNNKNCYHQLSSSAYAKVVLGIDDDEILNSIRYHTTGRANMSLMEEIIYLADFISADREYKDIDIVRQETEKGKEYGMLYATKHTIKSVIDREIPLHPDTLDTYNWLIKTYFKKG